MIPVFDGHNDFLQRMVAAGQGGVDLWRNGDGRGHIDLPRLRAGGMFGGFFAIWTPSPPGPDDARHLQAAENPPFRTPLPEPISPDRAMPHALTQAAALLALDRDGALQICTSTQDIRAAKQAGRIAAIMHLEGAEAIADLDMLHLWHGLGLRSLGPVWSRPTHHGHGVPFAFPASPDSGPGLTRAGRDLVRECNALKIMLDLAHLNEAGFNDIAALSDAPLVASHSAAHAICASTRNLTDRQLQVIAQSGGLVGLNFACGFLRPDGRRLPFGGFEILMRHLDHLLTILGEDGVALGSDFDGALMPDALPDATALPALINAMQDHGYGAELIEKVAWRNWIALLGRVWSEEAAKIGGD